MNRRSILLALIFAITLAPHSEANAQQPAQQNQQIVVVGQQLKQALQRFVNAATQAGPTDQIARWDREICPGIIGVDPAQAKAITERIAEVANTVDLRTTSPGCATLLDIVVTSDPEKLARSIAADFPYNTGVNRNAVLKRFVGSTKAVRSITISNPCGGGCDLPNSRLLKPTSPTLVAMIVIVDARRLGGVTVAELSDYLAVVALSNPPLDQDAPANSILSLFEPRGSGAGERQLTDYDLAFLAGVYGAHLNMGVNVQRSSIVNRMRRELRKDFEREQAQPTPHP